MIICEVIEEIGMGEERNELPVYGFRFIREKDGETICIMRDVFTEKEKAFALKELIEQNDLDEAQIPDVVEDALGT
ncbi:MAG: hypothetical protein IJB19_06700 [Clostridia bacterium]|nr:hypothetical protein [Clostridia bacterium]